VLAGFGSSIVVVRQPQMGQPAAQNTALAYATGELVAFQDADDIWPVGRLALMIDALADGIDGVYGALEQFVSPELDPASLGHVRIVQSDRPVQLWATSLIRRPSLDRVGALDTATRTSSVFDWMSRAEA
ncbi:MAG TPA: glycosyltransferase family A protein, partial [Ilumatobacteraceae bacterium]|nr:glycosyltransferase family A protein [Ilumatobacteraceae bacterium]